MRLSMAFHKWRYPQTDGLEMFRMAYHFFHGQSESKTDDQWGGNPMTWETNDQKGCRIPFLFGTSASRNIPWRMRTRKIIDKRGYVPLFHVWFLEGISSHSTSWCVKNAGNDGNGACWDYHENNYYGSFPHSLLIKRTSKLMLSQTANPNLPTLAISFVSHVQADQHEILRFPACSPLFRLEIRNRREEQFP